MQCFANLATIITEATTGKVPFILLCEQLCIHTFGIENCICISRMKPLEKLLQEP